MGARAQTSLLIRITLRPNYREKVSYAAENEPLRWELLQNLLDPLPDRSETEAPQKLLRYPMKKDNSEQKTRVLARCPAFLLVDAVPLDWEPRYKTHGLVHQNCFEYTKFAYVVWTPPEGGQKARFLNAVRKLAEKEDVVFSTFNWWDAYPRVSTGGVIESSSTGSVLSKLADATSENQKGSAGSSASAELETNGKKVRVVSTSRDWWANPKDIVKTRKLLSVKRLDVLLVALARSGVKPSLFWTKNFARRGAGAVRIPKLTLETVADVLDDDEAYDDWHDDFQICDWLEHACRVRGPVEFEVGAGADDCGAEEEEDGVGIPKGEEEAAGGEKQAVSGKMGGGGDDDMEKGGVESVGVVSGTDGVEEEKNDVLLGEGEAEGNDVADAEQGEMGGEDVEKEDVEEDEERDAEEADAEEGGAEDEDVEEADAGGDEEADEDGDQEMEDGDADEDGGQEMEDGDEEEDGDDEEDGDEDGGQEMEDGDDESDDDEEEDDEEEGHEEEEDSDEESDVEVDESSTADSIDLTQIDGSHTVELIIDTKHIVPGSFQHIEKFFPNLKTFNFTCEEGYTKSADFSGISQLSSLESLHITMEDNHQGSCHQKHTLIKAVTAHKK